jgi:hypothetical protein
MEDLLNTEEDYILFNDMIDNVGFVYVLKQEFKE